MTTTIEDANELLRAAVQIRREAQAAGRPHEEWYDVSQAATEPRCFDASTEETQPMPEKTLAEVFEHADQPLIEHMLHQYHLHRAGLTQDELDEALERLAGDGITHEQRPGSLAFLELLEELRTLHYEKTASYGGAADPFENVTASAKCGVEPWRRALCDLSDCVVRMQKYANGQPVDYENALIDAANWSLICLLKLREAKRA
jgi:hypothetical protein